MEKIIKLTESELIQTIKEAVNGVINEYDMPEPESASEDFYNSGFETTIKEKYPDMEFEFDVDNNGTVTVLDMNSGKYYIGNGEVEYDTVGMGYSNPNDYDIEAEEEKAHYDFYKCLKTIIQKIDEDKPDGIEENFLEIGENDINEAIKNTLNNLLKS